MATPPPAGPSFPTLRPCSRPDHYNPRQHQASRDRVSGVWLYAVCLWPCVCVFVCVLCCCVLGAWGQGGRTHTAQLTYRLMPLWQEMVWSSCCTLVLLLLTVDCCACVGGPQQTQRIQPPQASVRTSQPLAVLVTPLALTLSDATQPHSTPAFTPLHPQHQQQHHQQHHQQADVPSLCWLKTQDGGTAVSPLCTPAVAAQAAEAAGCAVAGSSRQLRL